MLLQHMVTLVTFYLSTMCISKYNNILSSRVSKADSVSVSSDGSGHLPNSTHSDSPALGQRASDEVLGSIDVEASIFPSAVSVQADPADTSEQIAASMEVVGPFLCELLLEHKAMLSKVLVGTDGRLLISDGKEGEVEHVTCL